MTDYENIVHLKSGGQLSLVSSQNMAKQFKDGKDWTKGTLHLEGHNQAAVPIDNIAFVETDEVEHWSN